MRLFYDERGDLIRESELFTEYRILFGDGETDCETFAEYVRECTGKNGTLTEIK